MTEILILLGCDLKCQKAKYDLEISQNYGKLFFCFFYRQMSIR